MRWVVCGICSRGYQGWSDVADKSSLVPHAYFLVSHHKNITNIARDGCTIDSYHGGDVEEYDSQNHSSDGGKLQPLKPFGCYAWIFGLGIYRCGCERLTCGCHGGDRLCYWALFDKNKNADVPTPEDVEMKDEMVSILWRMPTKPKAMVLALLKQQIGVMFCSKIYLATCSTPVLVNHRLLAL